MSEHFNIIPKCKCIFLTFSGKLHQQNETDSNTRDKMLKVGIQSKILKALKVFHGYLNTRFTALMLPKSFWFG